MKKEIITGMTLLGTLGIAGENGETTKDTVYKVVPRKSGVIVKDKKVIISNDKSMCSADRVLSKIAEGKILRDVKCSPSKTDPNYSYWRKVAAMKNIKIYDKNTQKMILQYIEDLENKYREAKSKYENIVGADRLYFDLVEIKPKEDKTDSEPKEDNKLVKKRIEQLIKKSRTLKDKNVPKKVIYINKNKDNTDIDNILKNYAEKLSNNF